MVSPRRPPARRFALFGAASTAASVLALVLCLASLASPWGAATPARAEVAPEPTECITVRGEAWMQAYGYRHVVIVENRCARPARCEVWTTSDPTPRHRLDVPAGESRSAVTRIGSPSREVNAQSECELR